MVRICAGLRFGFADLTSAAAPAAIGVAALVPIACTYQACWAAPAKEKQPKLVPGGGAFVNTAVGLGTIVPGTPALHAPRTNPVGRHGVPLNAQLPGGRSPPAAHSPARFVPNSVQT